MNEANQPLLQDIASTLKEILAELRKQSKRHEDLDQAKVDAEHKRQNPYENV